MAKSHPKKQKPGIKPSHDSALPIATGHSIPALPPNVSPMSVYLCDMSSSRVLSHCLEAAGRISPIITVDDKETHTLKDNSAAVIPNTFTL
jgi:hypothetical protein